MSLARFVIGLLLLACCYKSAAQQRKQMPAGAISTGAYVPANARLLYWKEKNTDSGKYIIYYFSTGCKAVLTSTMFYSNDTSLRSRVVVAAELPKRKIKLLTVHGNLAYEYYTRSKDAVAINPDEFRQHTERIYLDVMLKEKYPLKINLTSRQSNSPFFKNFYDLNFHFDKYAYNKTSKQELLAKLNQQVPQYKYPELAGAEAELQKQKEESAAVKNWLNAPSTLQKLIEERERIYYSRLKAKEDSLKAVAGSQDNIISKPTLTGSMDHLDRKNLVGRLTTAKEQTHLPANKADVAVNNIPAQTAGPATADSLADAPIITSGNEPTDTPALNNNIDDGSVSNARNGSLVRNAYWKFPPLRPATRSIDSSSQVNAIASANSEKMISGPGHTKADLSDSLAAITQPATMKLNSAKQKASGLFSKLVKKITSPKDTLLSKLNAQKDSLSTKLSMKEKRVTDSLSSLKSKLKNSKDSLLEKSLSVKDSLATRISSKIEKGSDSLTAIRTNATGTKDTLAQNTSGKADSIAEPFRKEYEKKKLLLDSLQKRVDSLSKKADSIKNKVERNKQYVRQKINASASERDLQKIAADNGIELEKQTGLQKALSSVKTLSLGRSPVNYTELTAQNITVTGVNIELNPSYYAAFTAGKIDYRFRDFFSRDNRRQPNSQYIVMGRFGVGDKEHKALIFSYFTGRKNTTGFSLSDSVKSYVNITGYSLEAIYKKDENTSLSAEFAKSTKPVTGTFGQNKAAGSLTRFSDNSNMGVNIKGQTIIPETNTRLSGFFRKTGENFQSFSLFTYNTDQTAWLMQLDQYFLKNHISITSMLRRNDFTNPFTDKTYKTSTVFKSLLVNLRFPKYPSLSIGYYPGTQLYMIDQQRIRESAYYILNGTAAYSYSLRRLSMNTLLVCNRYSSEATDSGFIAYKGVTYYAIQTIFLKKLQLQAGYSFSKQPELQFYTLEASADASLKSWLKLGAGLKFNNVAGGNNYWGQKGQLSLVIPHLGEIQVQYEKSYLPTITQTLYPVEMGRLSWYKNF